MIKNKLSLGLKTGPEEIAKADIRPTRFKNKIVTLLVFNTGDRTRVLCLSTESYDKKCFPKATWSPAALSFSLFASLTNTKWLKRNPRVLVRVITAIKIFIWLVFLYFKDTIPVISSTFAFSCWIFYRMKTELTSGLSNRTQ